MKCVLCSYERALEEKGRAFDEIEPGRPICDMCIQDLAAAVVASAVEGWEGWVKAASDIRSNVGRMEVAVEKRLRPNL